MQDGPLLLQEHLLQLRLVNRLHVNAFVRVTEAETLVDTRDVGVMCDV